MGNSNEENHDGFRQYRISVKAGLKTQKRFSPILLHLSALLISLFILAGTSLAQAEEAIVTGDELVGGFEISGNVALTTDYRFRGISQSNEDIRFFLI